MKQVVNITNLDTSHGIKHKQDSQCIDKTYLTKDLISEFSSVPTGSISRRLFRVLILKLYLNSEYYKEFKRELGFISGNVAKSCERLTYTKSMERKRSQDSPKYPNMLLKVSELSRTGSIGISKRQLQNQ
ncbi:hypothetical protein TIFTF001_010264 [Ficus carica]|uniref:Uncharacterized protein n=1 Tax=Ficus carica TaxID=3494 RepID=A0AA87ZW73_FICCA|nr:hypothetical protein TIFTF001_010264 [Ficus carica]